MRVVVIRFRGARFSPSIGVAGLQNICNNMFKLGNLLHSTQEVGQTFYHTVSSQTTSYIAAQMQYMCDFLQSLFHSAILDGGGTVMKVSRKCYRCDLFQTKS